ncbi:MAG: CAP domain-containing protein [Anaerolineaceae bacterium]|nr:CAP domain-containing protein [Anaerolineaceae bacterium]
MIRKNLGWITISLIVFSLLLIGVPEVNSQANYDVFLPIIFNPEHFSLNLNDRASSLDFYISKYIIDNPPPINWTGSHTNCAPGAVNPDYTTEVLGRINFYRTMAGIPEVSFSEESNRHAQAAALVMSVNNTLNHYPPDTYLCYSSVAYEGASSSNLSIGNVGWDAITSQMKDRGEKNYAVGHRRWILHPQTKIMGTGNIPQTSNYRSSSALRVFDDHFWDPRPWTRDGFVAWPPPGYVPYPVVYPRWSFSYPDANFDQATVDVLEEGRSIPVFIESVRYGYSESTIVWLLNGMDSYNYWPKPSKDTSYIIQIDNVLHDGQIINFNYEVIVFDPKS